MRVSLSNSIFSYTKLTILNKHYKLQKFLLVEPPPLPFSSLLGLNIHIRILFSNTFTLHSFHNARDHVSQPHSTTGNIIILYIYILKFFERSRGGRSVRTKKKLFSISCIKSLFYFLANGTSLLIIIIIINYAAY